MRLRFLFILFWVVAKQAVFAQTYERILDKETWTFQETGSGVSFPTKVPGNIFLDLQKNKCIPNPFLNNNEQIVQWVNKSSWTYTCNFQVSNEDYKRTAPSLVFKGLDTYARIYLNDSFLFESNNMFRVWEIPINSLLRFGDNELKIVFESAIRKAEALENQRGVALPASHYPHIRKSAYMFGWDWAPTLTGAGVWKSVALTWADECKIKEVSFYLFRLDSNVAEGAAIVLLDKATPDNLKVRLKVLEAGVDTVVTLLKGQTAAMLPIQILKPTLWWCNGMGKPYLYSFQAELRSGKIIIDKVARKIGIRSIELVKEKDEFGRSFYLKLNGVPVFVKGANWVPAHSFPSEVSNEKYAHLIKLAAEANLNLLRVWGGGYYEADEFYKLCDEYGILVWQDFMFACSMYPIDDAFRENVREEIRQQVERLRGYTSLALWCGNNEIKEGWYNWGWQKQLQLNERDSAALWHGYQNIFERDIPLILMDAKVKNFQGSTEINYHASSPANGWGRSIAYREEDVHYWGVWWGNEPFEKYEERLGRFVSEYGFQGLPNKKFLAKYIDTTCILKDTLPFKNHQKHPRGFETINKQLLSYGFDTSFGDTYIKNSQSLQALALRTAIAAHRNAQPYCMGTIFWQWNDCWPGISWSVVDFDGNPKPAYYEVKRAFDNPYVDVKLSTDTLFIHLFRLEQQDVAHWLEVAVGSSLTKDLEQETFALPTKSGKGTGKLILKSPFLRVRKFG